MAELMFRILKQDGNDNINNANQRRRHATPSQDGSLSQLPIVMMEDDGNGQLKDNTPMLWRSELENLAQADPNHVLSPRPENSIFGAAQQFSNQNHENLPNMIQDNSASQPVAVQLPVAGPENGQSNFGWTPVGSSEEPVPNLSLQEYMSTMPEAPSPDAAVTLVEKFTAETSPPGSLPESNSFVLRDEPSIPSGAGHDGSSGSRSNVEMMVLNHGNSDAPEAYMVENTCMPQRHHSQTSTGVVTQKSLEVQRFSNPTSDNGAMLGASSFRSFRKNKQINFRPSHPSENDDKSDTSISYLSGYQAASPENEDSPLIRASSGSFSRRKSDNGRKKPKRTSSAALLSPAEEQRQGEESGVNGLFKKSVRKIMNSQRLTMLASDKRAKTQFDIAKMKSVSECQGSFQSNIASFKDSFDIKRMLQAADRIIPIVNPNSRYRRYWDFMILVLVIYNAVAVPFDAGFAVEKASWIGMMENCIDAIFALDIIYNFRTAFVDAQGNMVRDSTKIARNYLKAWFTIDVLASIPFESFALMLGINVSEQVTLLAFLKTPRLLRLGRLLRFFERMKNANIFRIVRLMATMCLIAHWIACIWHFLYMQIPSEQWIFDSEEFQGIDAPSQFLVAFYSSFVLMMGDNVNPANDWEFIFCCVVLVVGACFMATVVGNMALLVSNMNVTAARHRTKMDTITDAVRYLGMPEQIQERVQEYFDYLSSFSHPGPDGMNTLGELPTSLYEDICALLHVRIIRTVPPFKNCEEPFIMQLVTKLKPAVYMPGDTIFRGGDVGHEMYLISKGKVAVINKNEEIVAILKEGTYFGELALLATARRVATCASLTHCDVNVLESTDLQLTMRDFPMSSAQVKAWAVSRLADLNPGMAKVSPAVEKPGAHIPQSTPTPLLPAPSSSALESRSNPQKQLLAPSSAASQSNEPAMPKEYDNTADSNVAEMLKMVLSKMSSMEMKLQSVEEQVKTNDATGGILSGTGMGGLEALNGGGILDDDNGANANSFNVRGGQSSRGAGHQSKHDRNSSAGLSRSKSVGAMLHSNATGNN